jgi:hypothetical protein
MKTKTAITLLSRASVAASTQVCACSSDHTAPAAPVDAAPGDVRVATMDGPLETSNEAGDDASEAGFVVQAAQLLDDMRGVDGVTDGPGTLSYWYTYSDRTYPWSEPPIFVADAGVLVPLDGTRFRRSTMAQVRPTWESYSPTGAATEGGRATGASLRPALGSGRSRCARGR